MLILMRRAGESIQIYPDDIPEGMTVEELFTNGPIEIKVTDTKGPHCKLGIDAPKELNVVRSEIHQRD